jgi:hypothetical protein
MRSGRLRTWSGASPCRKLIGIVLAVMVTAIAVVAPSPVAAQDADVDQVDHVRALAERYAPIVRIKAQETECDTTGEQFAPTAVEVVLDNPEVVLRQVGTGDPVLLTAPGASDLFRLGEGTYLDFPGDALRPACTFERDFRRFSADNAPTVYAAVVRQPDRPDQLALQYWFFWYYNLWNNQHEGDWEGIQLVFDAATVTEALAMEPSSVGYAQHEGGERAGWNDARLEREGDRPVVYPSAGSHASYFSTAVFLGRGPSEGFGCDDTTGPSTRLDPEVVVLPESVDDADDPLAWLMFDGRWGERHSGPYNGPTGPRDKERWTAPIDWHESLRTSSVVVPAGDSSGAAIVNAFCSVVEWGSVQVIDLQVSPIRLLVTIAVLAFVASRLVRRTVWDRVAIVPVVARRRAGQILRAAPRWYARRFGSIVVVGLAYLPVAALIGVILSVLRVLPFTRQLLDLGGDDSALGLVLTLLVGGLANLFAYQAVSAAVAWLMTTDEVAGTGLDAARAVAERWRELVSALLRAVLIVGVLLVSVVGIPWGVRQLVRYQFLAQAVMVDGRGGAAALDRSSELVRGRWFHTALVVAILNAVIAVATTTVGLLLLVTLQPLPLWAFSLLVSLTSVLVVPLAAIAQTLLYGDAVAEHQEVASVDTARVQSIGDGDVLVPSR